MERKLPEGLVWRRREDGSTFEFIYFKKQYRGRRIRGSSGTANPAEAERRLRLKLKEIDDKDIHGKRPEWIFRQGAEKAIREFQGSPRTLKMYAAQADILDPFIGMVPLRLLCKDALSGYIESRAKDGVSVRTINIGIEFVRLVLRKAAYHWRENGVSWIENCPIIPFEKGAKAEPYPLSWEEQERFLDLLPGRQRRMALFDVNTGLRDRSLVALRWSWEKHEPTLNESVFHIPGEYTKNKKPMILVLNRIARGVIESCRGQDPVLVFGKVHHATDKAWYKAWKEAGLPTGKQYRKGVHNLRHTFGKRLRDAGVDERDVQDLLHHSPKGITRQYSAPELRNLKNAVERIVPKVSLVAQKLHTA